MTQTVSVGDGFLAPRRLGERQSSLRRSDIDALGLRIETDLRLPGLQLTPDRGTFSGKIELAMAIIGTFSQHKGFDDALQGVLRELFERYVHSQALLYFSTTTRDLLAQPSSRHARPASGLRSAGNVIVTCIMARIERDLCRNWAVTDALSLENPVQVGSYPSVSVVY